MFIFILGLLGFDWPLLEIFRGGVALYLFVFWFLMIVFVAAASYKSGS